MSHKREGNAKSGKSSRWHGYLKAGRSSTGHGFALDRKSKMIGKYNKKFKKRNASKEGESSTVVPLAYDPLRDSLHEDANDMQTQQTQDSQEKSKMSRKGQLEIAVMTYRKRKEEGKRLKEEKETKRKEHELAVQKNISKRKETARSLMKRTKRGQPVLGNHISHLLDKIKNS